MTLQPQETNDQQDTFLQDCLSDLNDKRSFFSAGEGHGEDVEPGTSESAEHGPAPQRSTVLSSEPMDYDPSVTRSPSESGRIVRHLRYRRDSLDNHTVHLATSTFLSLVMVLVLLLVARLIVPSLVENIRYGWYRGQLRAEYELSGERLNSVSLDSLADVSQLVSRRAGPSVVHINLLSDEDPAERFAAILDGQRHPGMKYQGQGSGFVIDPAGYVLTNHHVIDGVGSIEVTLGDGRKLPAELVGTDPLTDLAVLKINAHNLMPIEWGDSQDVVVGTPVWAVGSPFGLQQTVTFGIISGKHRVDFSNTIETNSVKADTRYSDLMQSDVALNPGNSGGPLMNARGQVVGVNAAILGETFRGVSFSIPSRVAQRVSKQLMANGEVARGWLGVHLQDLTEEERFDEDGQPIAGARVVGFPRMLSSPAKRAGVLEGDKILAYEGKEVADSAELIRMIGETSAGQTITLIIERETENISIQVQLDRRSLEIDRPR